MKNNRYYAQATIKFVNLDILTGIVTYMVGSKLVDVTLAEARRLLSIAQDWQSGLREVTLNGRRNDHSVLVFNAHNHVRLEGLVQAEWVMKLFGISGNVA